MAAPFQANGFSRPPLLWIERNKNNRDALVTFDQVSFELHLVHPACNPTSADVKGKALYVDNHLLAFGIVEDEHCGWKERTRTYARFYIN